MFSNGRVQKKNKKSKLNGFQLYAIEFSGRNVESGDEIYVSAREIERATPSWNQLTNTEREKIKQRAKMLSAKVQGTQNRFNSIGQNLTDVETQMNKLEQDKNRRRNEIEQLIRDAADSCDLDNKTFYFVSATSFFDDSDEIYPAEIGFAKFSLVDGVYDSMSIEINPGDLPVGAAYTAKNIAENSHKFELPPECNGETNYMKILYKIIEFLPENEEVPVFFAEGYDDFSSEVKILKDTQRILKLIFEKAQEYYVARSIKVYPIIELFYYLKEVTTEIKNEHDDTSKEVPFKSMTDANHAFKTTEIEYRFRTDACEYHEEKEAINHCCLSKCIKYGYIFSKWCAQGYKYDLKPGFHFPKTVTTVDF